MNNPFKFAIFAVVLVGTLIFGFTGCERIDAGHVGVKVNLYGESTNKTWYPGVELNVLIDKSAQIAGYEGFGADTSQNVEFRFDRWMLEEKNTYPEIGDVIFFDQSYYEIGNTTEVQFVGGLPSNNFSVVCETFMVRKSSLNIEERIK